MKRPAVFFDRDGVVNVSPGEGYVLTWEAFQFSQGIEEALRLCRERGYALVLVTSQQGVGKGLMSQDDLDDIHSQMQIHLKAHGAEFDLILSCTHLTGTCECRKPSPAMIFEAERQLGLDLSKSWLVGDHDRDIQMATNAGVPNTVRILSHHLPGISASYVLAEVSSLSLLLEQHLLRID
jgi:D-glycero-D-manno-heptose 1,7-bisphosphate phosphatase